MMPDWVPKTDEGQYRRTTVLVVDDDELVRRVVAELLEDLVTSIFQAGSAREAVDMVLDQNDLDLVITDVNMPEMDGLQLVEKLKSMRPALPVILMSGRHSRNSTNIFLAKPFTLQSLLTCIASATGGLLGAQKHGSVP